MSAYVLPVGSSATAEANTLGVLVTLKEKLCKPFSTCGTILPTATVQYSNETPVLEGTTVFVPILAKITISVPSGCGCNVVTQLFTERFYVAFQGQTTLPASVTITNNGQVQGAYNVSCCKSRNYVIEDSLTITLVSPA